MSEPWYKDGLRFQCTRCGNCCTGPPGYVWVTPEEIAAIAEHRGESVDEVQALFTRLVGKRRSLKEKPNGTAFSTTARKAAPFIQPVRDNAGPGLSGKAMSSARKVGRELAGSVRDPAREN